LRLVLSAAYMKVADVQGFPTRANLGDSQGALANYRKSAGLVEPLLAKEPHRAEYLLQWVDVQTRLAQLLLSLSLSRTVTGSNRLGSFGAARRAKAGAPVPVEARLPPEGS